MKYFLGFTLIVSLTACERDVRVIGDGWHTGTTPESARAFDDSLAGLTATVPGLRYVGIGRDSRPDSVAQQNGSLLGDLWAPALLKQGPLSVVVGHPGSSTTNAAARFYAEAGVPLIAPNASARATPEVESWIFRLAPSDPEQGQFLARYALDSLRAKRLAVVFVGDAYGVGLLRGIRATLAERGRAMADEVEVPLGECYADRDEPLRWAVRAMMRRSRPDAVIIALPLIPANCVMTEIAAQDRGTWMIGSDALDAADVDAWVRRNLPAAPLRIATAWRMGDDSASKAFAAQVAARRGRRPRGPDALHRDALALAAAAIRETGGRPAQVRDWLASLGTRREPFLGLTGPISFEPGRTVRLQLRDVN